MMGSLIKWLSDAVIVLGLFALALAMLALFCAVVWAIVDGWRR